MPSWYGAVIFVITLVLVGESRAHIPDSSSSLASSVAHENSYPSRTVITPARFHPLILIELETPAGRVFASFQCVSRETLAGEQPAELFPDSDSCGCLLIIASCRGSYGGSHRSRFRKGRRYWVDQVAVRMSRHSIGYLDDFSRCRTQIHALSVRDGQSLYVPSSCTPQGIPRRSLVSRAANPGFRFYSPADGALVCAGD